MKKPPLFLRTLPQLVGDFGDNVRPDGHMAPIIAPFGAGGNGFWPQTAERCLSPLLSLFDDLRYIPYDIS